MGSRFIMACRVAVFALGLAGASLAHAATNYFLQIDGIKGESKDKDHKDWIDIDSFSWGLTSTVSSTGGGGGTGKATFSDFAWTQQVDMSTPKWFLDVATGKHISKVTLDVTQSFDGGAQSFFQLIFTGTQGTAMNITGAGESLLEQASMTSGATVKMRYRPQDAKGGLGAWVEGSFNIATNSTNATFSGDERVLLGLFSSGGNIAFDAGAVTAVPEPASAVLLLGGLVSLCGWRARRAASARQPA